MFYKSSAYSFLSRPSIFSTYNQLLVHTRDHHHSHGRKGAASLDMKLSGKQRKIQEAKRRKEDPDFKSDQVVTGMPQNLKRKVEAKRPALGHVVPINGKKGEKRTFLNELFVCVSLFLIHFIPCFVSFLAGGTGGPKLRAQGKARAAGLNNPSNLKILGGSARGRRLDSPDVYLRPMMGKVREAVYSTFTSFGLYEDDVYTKHLDIFCGSGSVGLESLSRGAQHCTFVDLAQDCCDCATRNIKWCQFGEDVDRTRVVRSDAIQALRDPVSVGIPEGFTYNLITLCPPYEEIVYADLLDAVTNSPVITEDTVVLVEYPVELGCLPHVLTRNDGGALVGVRNRKYGRTVIAIYVANPTGRLNESSQSRPEEFIDL